MIDPLSLNLSIPLLAIVLGLLDGVLNPCALSVLFFLVAYLLALGSRRKNLLLGLSYSAVVFLVYSLFMLGVLKILSIWYLGLIRILISIVIIFIGLIELKDFFFYGKWFSLGIPKPAKPVIEKLTKRATLPSIILLGFFVSLVEIPCAGGFPLAFLAIISSVEGIESFFYIILYNIAFVLPLVLLTLAFHIGFIHVEKAEKTRIKLRKYMRLIAGIALISLGLVMLLGLI